MAVAGGSQVGTDPIRPDFITGNLLARGRLRYLFIMSRRVSYRIHDRDDGLFDAAATVAPDKTYRREGFASLADAEEWIDGLRVLMAAIGAPVVQAQPEPGLRDAPPLPFSAARATEPKTAGARLRRFRDAMSASEDEAD
ncbi:hypothetical protein [Methylobacterium cerastii]|nr:hypothetical protein [Methylobacterium cerastii]